MVSDVRQRQPDRTRLSAQGAASGRNLAMGRPLAFLPRLAFCGQSGSLISLWPAQWPLGLGVADFVVISPKRNHIDGGSRLTMNRDRRSGGSTLKRSIRFLFGIELKSCEAASHSLSKYKRHQRAK